MAETVLKYQNKTDGLSTVGKKEAMKFSSKIEACQPSAMRVFATAAAAAEEKGAKVYHLNIGQPDIRTPDAYFEALRSFSEPVLSYAPSNGMSVLLDAVKGYYERIGVCLERDDILVTNGGSEAMQIVASCLLDDGDEIVIPEPFYSNYQTVVTLAGGTVRPITTTPEEGYRFAERERIEACLNERTRAIMITNPGNPTGTVMSRDELKLMLDIAREHDLFLICDEVYREFVYGGEELMSVLQFPGYEENVIVIDSVSKRFSACGARVGMLISRNRAFLAQALKMCQCRLSVATVDQIAAAALYGLDGSYFDAVRAEYKRRRDLFVEKLGRIPGVIFSEPKGAFYVMAALPVDDASRFQQWLLTDFAAEGGETLMFACGEPFYATPGCGKNEVRMAYVLREEDLSRALDLLAVAIREYNARS